MGVCSKIDQWQQENISLGKLFTCRGTSGTISFSEFWSKHQSPRDENKGKENICLTRQSSKQAPLRAYWIKIPVREQVKRMKWTQERTKKKKRKVTAKHESAQTNERLTRTLNHLSQQDVQKTANHSSIEETAFQKFLLNVSGGGVGWNVLIRYTYKKLPMSLDSHIRLLFFWTETFKKASPIRAFKAKPTCRALEVWVHKDVRQFRCLEFIVLYCFTFV